MSIHTERTKQGEVHVSVIDDRIVIHGDLREGGKWDTNHDAEFAIANAVNGVQRSRLSFDSEVSEFFCYADALVDAEDLVEAIVAVAR